MSRLLTTSSLITLVEFLNKLRVSSKLTWRRGEGRICPDYYNTFVTELNIGSVKYFINFARYMEGVKEGNFLLYFGIKKRWFTMTDHNTVEILPNQKEYEEARQLFDKLNETVPQFNTVDVDMLMLLIEGL